MVIRTINNNPNSINITTGPPRHQSFRVGSRSRTQSCKRNWAGAVRDCSGCRWCGAVGVLATEHWTVPHSVDDGSQDLLHFCKFSAVRAWFVEQNVPGCECEGSIQSQCFYRKLSRLRGCWATKINDTRTYRPRSRHINRFIITWLCTSVACTHTDRTFNHNRPICSPFSFVIFIPIDFKDLILILYHSNAFCNLCFDQ